MGMFLTSDSLAKLKISKQMEFSLFTLAKEYNARYSEKGTWSLFVSYRGYQSESPFSVAIDL